MLVWVVRRLVDFMVAVVVACTLFAILPVLTFAGLALLYYLRSPRESAGSSAAAGEDSTGALITGVLLFVLKGMLTYVTLLQSSVQLGSAAGCWLSALLIELAVQLDDASLRQLTREPPLQALDFLFLLIVAPALSAPAGGVHGLAAAWVSYLCAAFFWRAPPSTSVAIPMSLSVTTYLLAWSFGIFNWRSWIAGFDLTPADETVPEAALLAAGVALVLLIPSQTRLMLMPAALALSPSFRGSILDIAYFGLRWARIVVGSLPVLRLSAFW